MSTKYKKSKNVPTSVLCKRLNELSDAVTKGEHCIRREFVMRVPAELDYDADLVIAEASRRLKTLERLTVLAIKHCPIDHHNYEEILKIT